ncbi:MAG: 4Fe-4S binding protein [Chloroflexi bacterium]|nr:4Fe-4S binding protein [Chloroflexota bacterium]MBU1661704.1 4Fe-4S binding protein [Chloroflexota bacterium]
MSNDAPTYLSSLAEHWHIARTLRGLQIHFDPKKCTGIWQCYEVCPIGCWKPDRDRRVAIHQNAESCIACGACILQCPEGAIKLE